ncbi:uncharacterized protein DUF4245 [Phycicoccus duodecadis]|uniref:Uncharacterized protein DUF4245 n=1 Tax=Phycicoccus duodecadis TaxID=173053 RepID=A0A2N3YHC0_9MICO|nr:uncharacterized protein DUF4245 [Phycicoccus duodecadis]
MSGGLVGDDGGVSTPVAPKSRYSMGSVKNLVYSLLAVLGMVAVLVLIVPRVNTVGGPPVDIAAQAQDVRERTGWPIVVPEGLPAGWTPTSVRYVRVTDGFMTWHVGYRTPSGSFVAVEQTKDPSRAWVAAQTNRAPKEGTVEIAGRTWDEYVRDNKVQNSLLSVPPTGSGELATLVTGNASFDEMTTYVQALRPVR